jgi:DUF971 family protein
MNDASSDLTITNTEVVNDMVLIQWSSGEEGMVPLKKLREHCPCAVCAGETDVFGNVYRGPQKEKTADSYRLVALERVGYYGLASTGFALSGPTATTAEYSLAVSLKLSLIN